MGARVEWSPEAIEDVEKIAEYIARDSEFYANSVVTKIIAMSRDLAEFPRSGRVVPELNHDDLRERFIYSYRLLYKIEKERILIVAVIHGKRLLDNIPDRFKIENKI